MIKLTLSYDGTNYCGWQKQKNGVSVQEIVEKALKELTGKEISVVASGRTDAGVHAEAQVVSFEYDGNIPPDRLYLALNTILPNDVKSISSKEVEDSFNARKSAKKKTYVYSFYVSKTILPLLERYATLVKEKPDLDLMKKASKLLIGKHDFSAFCSVGSSVKTTTRTIYSIDVFEEGNLIKVCVCGNGFLYNMVRIIAGTLLEIGQKKRTEESIVKALESGKRELLAKTLPAKGLSLKSVEYR